LQQADEATAAEKNVACCYARSNKYWVEDPAGVAWETFHSLGSVPTYGEPSDEVIGQKACCSPVAQGAPAKVGACCG
jgi:hypothetical protein